MLLVLEHVSKEIVHKVVCVSDVLAGPVMPCARTVGTVRVLSWVAVVALAFCRVGKDLKSRGDFLKSLARFVVSVAVRVELQRTFLELRLHLLRRAVFCHSKDFVEVVGAEDLLNLSGHL